MHCLALRTSHPTARKGLLPSSKGTSVFLKYRGRRLNCSVSSASFKSWKTERGAEGSGQGEKTYYPSATKRSQHIPPRCSPSSRRQTPEGRGRREGRELAFCYCRRASPVTVKLRAQPRGTGWEEKKVRVSKGTDITNQASAEDQFCPSHRDRNTTQKFHHEQCLVSLLNYTR